MRWSLVSSRFGKDGMRGAVETGPSIKSAEIRVTKGPRQLALLTRDDFGLVSKSEKCSVGANSGYDRLGGRATNTRLSLRVQSSGGRTACADNFHRRGTDASEADRWGY